MTNSTNALAPLHLILGAGQIGVRLAALLAARGARVRLVARELRHLGIAGVEEVAGDMTDLAFAAAAARGAAVVYDCMNPPYHMWPELLLPIARGALHAAATAGAKLVALDCLYMYGRPTGPLTEDAPLAPCSKKGELRVELAALRLGAHRSGEVRVAIGRASDFFGPNLPFSCWSERFFRQVLAGEPGECFGDPDMPHSYTYADDVAEALAILGARDEADGRVWHLPTNPAESSRALAHRLGGALGVAADLRGVTDDELRAAGEYSPLLREIAEMAYQWRAPFVIDDTRFRAQFGMGPTPIDDAVAATARWALRCFAKGA